MSTTSATVTHVVNLNYEDLINQSAVDLSESIEKAFGPDGLGILTVSNVPQFSELRAALLPLAHQFATLPKDVQSLYEHSESNYSFGWSHGKEMFNGKRDVAKGSFYANPQYDVPTTDASLIQQYPFYCCENIWPEEHVPQLSTAFKQLGQLIVSVGLLVAKQCDLYVEKLYNHADDNRADDNSSRQERYERGKLHKTISQSKCAKGRLLYYFPIEKDATDDDDNSNNNSNNNSSEDNWCGWHLDHGSLTGLTSAQFMDGTSGQPIQMTDPNAGLFIRNRHGDLVKAVWSPDQIAFQIGESAQIHSGGKLVATPHCVRGTTQPNVGRATLAVFMQPQWDVIMDTPVNVPIKDAGIAALESGMDFNAFTQKKLQEYYGGM